MAETLKKRMIKNSFWSFISSVINRIGALIFTIILARFLMPEGYGIYSIVLSVAMICYTFTDLGINQTLVRYISSALSKNKEKIPSYHKYLLKIKLIFILSVSILLFLLAWPLSFYVFKNQALFLPFLVASFYIFILSFEGFYFNVFYAIEKIKYISIKESLTQILRIVFALFIFYFVASSYQIIGIFLALTLCSLILLIFILYYLKKLIPSLFKKQKAKINKRKVNKFVGYLTIASISGVFFSYIDSIMLAFFLLPEYVGYYKAAFSLVIGVVGIIGFPIPLLLPLFTKSKNLKIQEIFNKIFRYLIMIMIPSIFGLLVLGKYFIRLFYGASYLPSLLPFYFLCFLIFPMICVGFFLSFFLAKEKPQIFAKIILITFLINLVLNLIFIKSLLSISPLWATAGAGIATLISWFFYFFISVWIARKEFNFIISFKPIIKPLIASLIMVGILIYLSTFIKDMNIILGASLVTLGGLVYFMSMILIKGIKKSDLELLKLLIKK